MTSAGLLEQFLAALRRRRRDLVGGSPAALAARRPPLLALPAPPGAEAGPVCPACRYRHPPIRGLAPTYATVIDGTPDLGRPRPLRQQAAAPAHHPNPWRTRWGRP